MSQTCTRSDVSGWCHKDRPCQLHRCGPDWCQCHVSRAIDCTKDAADERQELLERKLDVAMKALQRIAAGSLVRVAPGSLFCEWCERPGGELQGHPFWCAATQAHEALKELSK